MVTPQKKEIFQTNFDFVILLFILFAMNIPLWNHQIWPQHDTILFDAFPAFAFYNELFFNHDLARWMPYGTYGIESDYWQLNALTPASSFTGFFGLIFQIRNFLLLYKWSVFFQQVMLLVGTYLLSKQLFVKRSTVFFVCLGVLTSSIWMYEIYFNFRIYYLLPLVFYFLILFFKNKEPHYFWIAASATTVSLFGNIPYFLFFYMLILLIFFGVFGFRYASSWMTLFQWSKKNLLFLILFVLVTVPYLYLASHMLSYVISYSFGRDPVSQVNSLKVFMKYGLAGRADFLRTFFPMDGNLELTFYIGFLPFLFLLYGFYKVRSHEFFVFAVMAVFLFMFCLESTSFVARAVYYLFAPIRIFRYAGKLVGVLRFFLLICAGFGLDAFLLDHDARTAQRGRLQFHPSIFCMGISLVAAILFLSTKINVNGYPKNWLHFYYFALAILAIAILILSGFYRMSARKIQIVVVMCFALDMFSYQNMAYTFFPKWAWVKPETIYMEPYRFQEKRSNLTSASQKAKALFDVVNTSRVRRSIEAYNFIQFDPCFTNDPTILESKRLGQLVNALYQTQDPIFSNATIAKDFLTNPKTAGFLDVIGCETPKLKLISHVMFAEDHAEAVRLVQQTPNLGQKIVLMGVPSDVKSTWVSTPETEREGNVRVTSFSLNQLTAEVNVGRKGGAWLYYADSYHPGWRAFVNGRQVPIAEANLAFKAVKLNEGKSMVQFVFSNGWSSVAGYGMVFFGFLFSCWMLQAVVVIGWPQKPNLFLR